MSWGAIVVAAGRGTRFGRPKQLVPIAGVPMLAWCVRVFSSMPEVARVIVVTERDWLDEVAQVVAPIEVVPGGASRQASVRAGIDALDDSVENVFVHDGARPLIDAQDVRRGMKAVRAGEASLLALPVVDTIKAVDPQTRCVRETLERATLWAAQTPQFATLRDMRRAHEVAVRDRVEATDDAMLLERIGVRVHVVEGSPENFKVTLPEDLARAEHALKARQTCA